MWSLVRRIPSINSIALWCLMCIDVSASRILARRAFGRVRFGRVLLVRVRMHGMRTTI